MRIRPYNIIQFIRTDEYITIKELSKRTNTNIETIKKNLVVIKEQLANSGYHIESGKKGIILVRDYGDYLPSDLIFFKSPQFDFAKVFIKFIKSGMTDSNVIVNTYNDMFYTYRQMSYFFEKKLNIPFANFKYLSKMEYFTLFVEHCMLCFSCKNIKEIFNQYINLEVFNNLMFSQQQFVDFSPNDYLMIYSIIVFDKINISPVGSEYDNIQSYFKRGEFHLGLKQFKSSITYTQNASTTNAMIDYYYKLIEFEEKSICFNQRYKLFDEYAIELEKIQKELTTKIISNKRFIVTLVYEGNESHLAVIKGTLRGNYPNIKINTVPSWLYLYYDNISISSLVFSNTLISDDIPIIPPRDKEGNYDLDVTM
ncbi:hypothetical protein RZE82_08740 [Mollicutes bacterium LVI A0039]|nr:hypothetical protein RZE82_08740 [Mollicutes bacterium LVI A0039]